MRPASNGLRAKRIACSGRCHWFDERTRRILRQGITRRTQKGVTHQPRALTKKVGVGAADQVSIGPRRQQLVLEVVPQQRG